MHSSHTYGSRGAQQSGSHMQALLCILVICMLILSACGGHSSGSGSGSALTAGGSTNVLSLSGTVSGLTANNPVVLVNNADNATALTLSANGSFSFTQRYATNAPYQVTVQTQPNMQSCSVTNGSGKLPTTTTLSVTCTGLGKLAAGTPFATADAASLPASVTVNTIAGIAGQATQQFTEGLSRISTFHRPYKAASDGTYLYVTEAETNAIRQIRLSDNYTSNFLDTGFDDGNTVAGGAEFNGIGGIATDGKYLYVGDMDNCAIRRIEIATKAVETVVGQVGVCRSDTTYADGRGTSITLGATSITKENYSTIINLNALALSDDGKSLYFGDITLLRKLDLKTGEVSTVLGKLGTNGGSGNLDGSFKDAYIATVIQGIAVNGNNLYVLTGTHDHTLRRVDLAAQTVSTLELFYADGSINPEIYNTENKNLLASVQKTNPAFKPFDTGWGLLLSGAMVTDGTYLYIASLASNQVVRIRVDGSDNGIPTSLVVSPPSPSHADGPGNKASFFYPVGMGTDGKNLYVVEYWNYTVRKITPNN